MAVRALNIKDPHPTTSELRGIHLFGINIKHTYRAQLLPPPDRQLTAPIRETILRTLHFEKGTAEIQKEDLAILVGRAWLGPAGRTDAKLGGATGMGLPADGPAGRGGLAA